METTVGFSSASSGRAKGESIDGSTSMHCTDAVVDVRTQIFVAPCIEILSYFYITFNSFFSHQRQIHHRGIVGLIILVVKVRNGLHFRFLASRCICGYRNDFVFISWNFPAYVLLYSYFKPDNKSTVWPMVHGNVGHSSTPTRSPFLSKMFMAVVNVSSYNYDITKFVCDSYCIYCK